MSLRQPILPGEEAISQASRSISPSSLAGIPPVVRQLNGQAERASKPYEFAGQMIRLSRQIRSRRKREIQLGVDNTEKPNETVQLLLVTSQEVSRILGLLL
jgi:hypothetical protein